MVKRFAASARTLAGVDIIHVYKAPFKSNMLCSTRNAVFFASVGIFSLRDLAIYYINDICIKLVTTVLRNNYGNVNLSICIEL